MVRQELAVVQEIVAINCGRCPELADKARLERLDSRRKRHVRENKSGRIYGHRIHRIKDPELIEVEVVQKSIWLNEQLSGVLETFREDCGWALVFQGVQDF